LDAAETQKLPIRVRVGIYGAAVFSFSMMHMVILVLPLWVVLLEPSPLVIGIVLGSRQFLTLLFSIHGGTLMDRLDTRRLMLFFAVIAVAIQPLFPSMPWVMALIALQMIGGLADTMEWMGAQTLTGQLTSPHFSYPPWPARRRPADRAGKPRRAMWDIGQAA
jgi:MFS family permease